MLRLSFDAARFPARARNRPIKLRHTNLRRPNTGKTINQFASPSQPFWVCDRDNMPFHTLTTFSRIPSFVQYSKFEAIKNASLRNPAVG
jgi:hypothetical protein